MNSFGRISVLLCMDLTGTACGWSVRDQPCGEDSSCWWVVVMGSHKWKPCGLTYSRYDGHPVVFLQDLVEWPWMVETTWSRMAEASRNEAGTALLMMVLADSDVPKYVEDIVDTPRTSNYLRTLRNGCCIDTSLLKTLRLCWPQNSCNVPGWSSWNRCKGSFSGSFFGITFGQALNPYHSRLEKGFVCISSFHDTQYFSIPIRCESKLAS